MYQRKTSKLQKYLLIFFCNSMVPQNARKKIKSLILSPHTRPFWGIFHHPGWLNPCTFVRYYRYRARGVPFKQANAFGVLKNLEDFHQRIDAVGIPVKGTLLGAVRNNAFAGRPGDFDFFVIVTGGVEHYLTCLSDFGGKYGLRQGAHKYTNNGPAKLKVIADIPVDVVVCDHDPKKPGILVEDNNPRPIFGVIDWPGVGLAKKTGVFGVELFVPDNYESLLVSKYGVSWEFPQGEQWGVSASGTTKKKF